LLLTCWLCGLGVTALCLLWCCQRAAHRSVGRAPCLRLHVVLQGRPCMHRLPASLILRTAALLACMAA
jgi:hypothetical protein